MQQQTTATVQGSEDAADPGIPETTAPGGARPRRVVACDTAHEPVDDDAPVCVPIAANRFAVSRAGVVVGFIDRVGSVCVCLRGPWYSVAVETHQVFSFGAAVALFRRG